MEGDNAAGGTCVKSYFSSIRTTMEDAKHDAPKCFWTACMNGWIRVDLAKEEP